MIEILRDHWQVVASLVAGAFAVGGGWALLKRDIKELREEIQANRSHMDAKFREMKEGCAVRLIACQKVHTGIQASMEEHHTNTDLHTNDNERELQQEWRRDVLKRFDRLEDLLLKSAARAK